jgi:hypothetical protein
VKYARIDLQCKQYPLERLCAAVEVSLSGFHRYRLEPESLRAVANRGLLTAIRARHLESDGTDGAPRIHRDLLDEGRSNASSG